MEIGHHLIFHLLIFNLIYPSFYFMNVIFKISALILKKIGTRCTEGTSTSKHSSLLPCPQCCL